MNETVFAEAARWQAIQHRDDMDWDSFTAWLAADPGHRDAFDELALLDDQIDRHRAALRGVATTAGLPAAPVRLPIHRRPVARWSVAAAALVAGVIGVATLRQPGRDAPVVAEYRAGAAPRSVSLPGGVAVALAAGSTLRVEGAAADRLSVTGRALFDVRHDPRRRLAILAAGYRIDDIGTRFDVATGAGMVEVAVAEGQVAVASPSGGAAVTVAAGRSLTGLADGKVTLAAVRARKVGGWRSGPLVYDGVPLGIVAADVARVSGRAVTVDPAIAARRFSGVLAPARGDGMAAALASTAGLRSGRAGDAITLRDPASR